VYYYIFIFDEQVMFKDDRAKFRNSAMPIIIIFTAPVSCPVIYQ
jgi:hypothetical protein